MISIIRKRHISHNTNGIIEHLAITWYYNLEYNFTSDTE